ncbi:MAG: (2Fe-2S)-binding protein, partial [Synergistaceae bacterium]|nr:(2Fe-2S)-binding protein [Synergistaceae bacterium]
CRDIILRELAKATGEPLDKIDPGTIRPPVKPIKLGLCAYGKEGSSI